MEKLYSSIFKSFVKQNIMKHVLHYSALFISDCSVSLGPKSRRKVVKSWVMFTRIKYSFIFSPLEHCKSWRTVNRIQNSDPWEKGYISLENYMLDSFMIEKFVLLYSLQYGSLHIMSMFTTLTRVLYYCLRWYFSLRWLNFFWERIS